MTEVLSDVSRSCVLRRVVQTHRQELVRSLDVSTLFLTYLAKHRLIEPAEILKYEHYKEKETRNSELLDRVVDHEDETADSYTKFLDALRRSDQVHLAAMLTSIDQELQLVDEYQNVLEQNLEEIHSYLRTESRRTEVRYSTISPEYKRPPAHLTLDLGPEDATKEGMAAFLYKVHQSTKSTLVHFDRCREVIDKLHSDCEVVAKKNGDKLDKLRECATLVRKLRGDDPEAPEFERNEEDPDDVKIESGVVTIATPKSKQSESETLMESVQKDVSEIQEKHQQDKLADEECLSLLEQITKTVRSRRAVLEKHTEPQPKHLINRHTGGNIIPIGGNDSKLCVKEGILQFMDEFEGYVHQESQVTHKYTLDSIKSSTSNQPTNKDFDQIQHDMMHLSKEIRRMDYDRAEFLLRQIVDATKSERAACLKLVDDITRMVRIRRVKLQEETQGNPNKRRVTTYKKRTSRVLNTSFSKRVKELAGEMDVYLDLQNSQSQRQKEYVLKLKEDTAKELRYKLEETKELEKRIKDVEFERDRYCKLYDHLNAMQDTRILTKPTIPKRAQAEGAPPTANVSFEKLPPRHSHGHPDGRSRRVPDYVILPELLKPKPPNKVNNQRVGPSRPTRATLERLSRRPVRPGPINMRVPREVKPKLTPRARHLTRLKTTAREKQRAAIQADRNGQDSKVQYTIKKS